METYAQERGAAEPVVLGARHVLEQVRDQAMFLVDRQGRIASWNEGVGLILRWPEHEWIGQPFRVAFTPEDVDAGVPEDELRTATAHGRADDDRWMMRRDGERFFALGATTRLLDESGRLMGFLKALRDHTAPRRAEVEREQLLAAHGEARLWAENQAAALTAAIEAIGDGVCIGDATGFSRCNAAALRLFGAVQGHELQGDMTTLVARLRLRREREGALVDAAELPYTQAVAGRHAEMELWATQPGSGQDVFLRSAAAPVVVEGRVVGAVVIHTDLAQRLQLQERGRDLHRVESVLHERDAELRALLKGVRDYAIFTVDPAGRISSWHDGAELMYGYTHDEALGMPLSALNVPEQRGLDVARAEMGTAVQVGEYKGEEPRQRQDGSRFDAAVVLTPLRGPQGELLGFLKLTQDITERKRMEHDRERMLRDAQAARADAERASHSKGEFLATISHELRTPLSAILGWAHVLERGVFDPETVKHGLAAISRNARIQVQLIEDLLDMNRIESGQLRLDLQRIELGGVIAAAIDSALPAATAKGIGLRTVFGPSTGMVMGDAARLQQVVANLLNNAIKFTPTGGQVSVALTQWGEQAQIAVADTGQGIEPAFLDRVFDRFQQQDATTTRRYGGLGIGLAIVRHLVQLHGGTVRAHSLGTGMGSTFTVTLPAAAVPAPAALPPSGAGTGLEAEGDGPVRLDGVSVLLVDDEADVRAVTMRVLQDAGAHVLAADSAAQALDLLQRERPQVILSDIGMPQVDGYDFMRRVRGLQLAEGGGTPAAAFTAYTRPEDRQRALDAGYQIHLAKPVPPTALVLAVAGLVKSGAAVPQR